MSANPNPRAVGFCSSTSSPSPSPSSSGSAESGAEAGRSLTLRLDRVIFDRLMTNAIQRRMTISELVATLAAEHLADLEVDPTRPGIVPIRPRGV